MEEPGSTSRGKHMLAVNMRSPIYPISPVSKMGKTFTSAKLSRLDEVSKTPPTKSSLSALLSDDDSMSINNTVIITKTPITNTTEPFKKVETPASPAVGINISVSLLPDANNQTSSPSKKTMTQAETAKRQMTLNASARSNESSPIAKQPVVALPITPNVPVQPAGTGKKAKARKSDTERRAPKISLPRIAGKAASSEAKKNPKPAEEASEMVKAKEPTKPAAIVNPIVNRKSLPQTQAKKLDTHTNEVSAAPVEAAGISESNEASESVAAEKLTQAQGTQKKDARKSTGQRSLKKSKSKEVLAVAEATEPASSESMPSATNAPSESRDSSTERKKRTSRVTKQLKTKTVVPMTRACSHARSLAGTPTPSKQRNPSNERQPPAMPALVPLPSKPQRQARKSLKQTKAEALAQSQSQSQAEGSEPAKATQSRKRKPPAKSPAGGAKRLKEQPAMSETAVAFPVRITAAASAASETPIAEPMATAAPPPPPPSKMSEKPVQKHKDLQLLSRPLLPKLRKLRVRLNRSVIPNWLKRLKQAELVAQRLVPATAVAPPSATISVASTTPKQAEPLISKSQQAARRPQVKLPIVNSVPLPVPLPVLEVKPEVPELEEEPQSIHNAAAAPALHLEVDVPVPSIAQVAANISSSQNPTRVEPATITQPGINMASSASSVSSAISNHANTVTATAPAPASAPANTTANCSIPPANAINDQNTFGTTKMFSFLYPSRYQRSYSHVGLDFCCPNLDGPMQAIDPTRLHSKAEVPVLELPQYMVISTKIISRQDKNIPPKVRAKLEQLAAAKDAETNSAISAVLPASTAAVATPPVPAVASSAPPTMSHVETMANQLPPQDTTLAKKPPPANAAPAAATAAAAPPKTLSSPPPLTAIRTAKRPARGMLQLPPICPTDKIRMDLQSRVQLFDHVLQGLSRRAAVMSVLERQQVIENIVKTSALLPVDVEMAIKLLESYSYCLYAVNSANVRNLEQRQQQLAAAAAGSISNTRVAAAVSSAPAAAPAPAGSPNPTPGTSNSKPVYDAGNKIIGYQYSTPNMSMKSSRGTFVTLTPSSTAAASGASPSAAGAATQQRGRLTAASGKVTTINLTSPAAVPTRVAKRVGSGTIIPFNPSPTQKTYAGRSTTAASARNAGGTADKAAPVGIVNGMPQLGVVPQAALAEDNINRTNLFIVNQLMSQQEECILPDAIGTVETAAADIKGELEDAETLT
ncbi:hypothetical protein AWZ03_013832 [Drosophila navojoa]|uniref:Uncharacterized protein n=2 Tax=Drosophila navojoa TaxID=7232 RepID=A0A484AVV9_DRONA|nr:hypothetical protein AWZ03_013832 [Drosophila navojoa]